MTITRTGTPEESTAMGDGIISAADVKLAIAIKDYWNTGGTRDRAHKLVNDGFDKLEEEGHRSVADKATALLPDSSSPDDDAEATFGEGDQEAHANKAIYPLSPSQASADSEQAEKARQEEIEREKQRKKARAEERKRLAAKRRQEESKSMLKSLKIRGSKSIGDLQVFELLQLEDLNRHEIAIMSRVRNFALNLPSDAYVRDFLNEEQLKRIVQAAAYDVDVRNV